MRRLRWLVVGGAILAGITGTPESSLVPGAAAAAPEVTSGKVLVNRDSSGIAIRGYDPVAYFTDGKPVEGDPKITATHEGATYRFASEEHRTVFIADPAKYAPAYGGYCGYAASINRLSPTDPKVWQIVDGRLVLQNNAKAFELFNEDLSANEKLADENWPKLVAKNGTALKLLVNVDDHGLALQGYDPVAYFTEGKPVKGSPEHLSVFSGATYHFASEEHRAMFENDPLRYAPQFGGYCGYAASINKLAPIDPFVFQIVDGRLVLQYSKDTYKSFNKDLAKSLAKADANWAKLVEKKGR